MDIDKMANLDDMDFSDHVSQRTAQTQRCTRPQRIDQDQDQDQNGYGFKRDVFLSIWFLLFLLFLFVSSLSIYTF